jgi:hypothetical protein
VPPGTRLLLDESIVVGRLEVAGELATAPVPLTVQADAIRIAGGTWSAGGPSAPHPASLRVTLRGTDRTVTVTDGGTLALHGPVPSPVFVPLAAGAEAGARTLPVASAVSWAPGDEVLVTPSGHYGVDLAAFRFAADARVRGTTERFALSGVQGGTLTLDAPLAATRWGVLDAGSPVDLRAEAAHLSRAIVLAGADDATWEAGTGVSLRVEGDSTLSLGGVRLQRAGVSAPGAERAAITFEAGGEGVTRRVVGSVVDDVASRGVVLRGATGVELRDNVLTRIRGHGIWSQWGVERDLVFEGNLVTDVRPPRQSGPSTVTEAVLAPSGAGVNTFCGPSGFVLAHPGVTLRGNVVADLPGCAYWFSFAPRTSGPFAGTDLAPSRVPFGVFEDNTARAVGNQGVLFGRNIATDATGQLRIDETRYAPQTDTRASAPEEPGSALRAVLTRPHVLGAQAGGFQLGAARVSLEAPVSWGNGFVALRVGGELQVRDGLFVGRLGAAPQPLAAPSLTEAPFHDALRVERTRVAHYRADPELRAGGVLRTVGPAAFGFDLTLEGFSDTAFEDVELGVRAAPPFAPFDVTGPVLDAPGFGGFPGRWWVDDVPYFTEGYTCTPSPRGRTGQSGQLCAAPGYFGLFDVRLATAAGTEEQPEAELVRAVTGSPSVGYPRPATELFGPVRALPVPRGEAVALRFPAHATTPRTVSFSAWGRPGQKALLRIPYPVGTSFTVTARHPFVPSSEVLFTQAATRADVEEHPAGTRYFYDGTHLVLSLRSDLRGALDARAGSVVSQVVTIRATGPGLP